MRLEIERENEGDVSRYLSIQGRVYDWDGRSVDEWSQNDLNEIWR